MRRLGRKLLNVCLSFLLPIDFCGSVPGGLLSVPLFLTGTPSPLLPAPKMLVFNDLREGFVRKILMVKELRPKYSI
jgi:hypothetical protein